MVSAYLSARGRAGCAVAAFGGERVGCGAGFAGCAGPGFTGCASVAARSRAGRVALCGWLRWRCA